MAGIVIKIDVDKEVVVRKFKMFQKLMPYGLLPAWVQIANRLEREEMALTPIRTGRLRSTIQTNARVLGVDSYASAVDPRNGYNYARIQHDGGYASGYYGPHIIRGKYYMTIPLFRSPSYAVPMLEDQMARIIAMCGL